MLPGKLGFVGGGRMATALAQGFVKAGLCAPEQILACDPLSEARAQFAQATGGKAVEQSASIADEANVIFLAVKPQHAGAALGELAARLAARHLLVSIVAGLTLGTMRTRLVDGPRLIRAMPNTPALIGEGASGYCLGPGATEADGDLVGRLLQSVGRARLVPESLLDAVTGLSGSGPAFVYVMIEALSDGGVRMGLPRDVATELAAQTVLGAAAMVQKTGLHPGVLKDQVASPGGTTIAGLSVLESNGVRGALIAAVEAATRRAEELGRGA